VSVPPSRRRPIPTPPAGGRPKVAGLHRRAAESGAPEVEDVAPVAPEHVEEPDELKAPTPDEWTPPTTKQPAAKQSITEKKKEFAEKKARVAADEEKAGPAPTSKQAWLLPAALLLVAVLLGGLGTFFLVKSRAVSYDAALVDSATTSAVNGQIREAVEKSFSYNFADVEATEKAARELLTGKALCQYNAVFGPVKEVAPQQKLVVTVRVVSSAVSSLKDGHATVLVFADQVTTRTTDNQSGGGTAMLRVSAVDDGGRWKIDNMEMFGATAEQNRQLQGC
jgi:Mce-associated membrane protein